MRKRNCAATDSERVGPDCQSDSRCCEVISSEIQTAVKAKVRKSKKLAKEKRVKNTSLSRKKHKKASHKEVSSVSKVETDQQEYVSHRKKKKKYSHDDTELDQDSTEPQSKKKKRNQSEDSSLEKLQETQDAIENVSVKKKLKENKEVKSKDSEWGRSKQKGKEGETSNSSCEKSEKENKQSVSQADDANEERKEERKKKKREKMLKKNLSETVQNEEKEKLGPDACQLALDYLDLWNSDRDKWKFQKVRQVWLLQNMYVESKVDDTQFEKLLLYLEGLKGLSRETTLKKAEEIVNCDDMNEESEKTDVSEVKVRRAREIIQILT